MSNSTGSTTPYNDNSKIETILTINQQEGEAPIKHTIENVQDHVLTVSATILPPIKLIGTSWTINIGKRYYYHHNPDTTASGRNRIGYTGGYITTVSSNTYSGPLHVPNSSAITISNHST